MGFFFGGGGFFFFNDLVENFDKYGKFLFFISIKIYI